MTNSSRPNVVIILGSQSGVIKPVVESLAQECQVVRLFNRNLPEPMENCVDVGEIGRLSECLDNLPIEPQQQRLGFIGAAFAKQSSLFINETFESLNLQITTNITLYLDVMSQLLPRMVRVKYGRSVYLSSFKASSTGKGTSIYSASKAFGETFFSGLGKEYGRFNVSASSIRMGYFEGGMMSDYDEDQKKKAKQTVSMNRFGNSTDLLNAINFIFDTPYVSSGVIELNGGLNLG
jgi:NADP-dependent 3-hydroxy acid dehydrogenase YdfG